MKIRCWRDISPSLHSTTPVWPGDAPVRLEWTLDQRAGDSVTVGRFSAGTHAGAHVDAPLHFIPGGPAVDSLDPSFFIGPCRVVEATRQEISPDQIHSHLESAPERLLLKTGGWKDRSCFPAAIPALDPGLPPLLQREGIRLLGIDLPSVDSIDCARLPLHHAFAAAGILLLENLDLTGIEPGDYFLSALPLRIAGGDAAPVRAVLGEYENEQPGRFDP